MLAIRGATTITADEPQQIREAVAQLLREIAEKNGLRAEEMLFILFSNTADIRSLYPAKAAREAGFVSPALFSAAEPDIAGALPLCIRSASDTAAATTTSGSSWRHRLPGLLHPAGALPA